MIESIEDLKKERPDLVESFENMSKSELLEQCYKEALDAINMESRVAVFMEHCTRNMSNTTYTEDAIKALIAEKEHSDKVEFCESLLKDGSGVSSVILSLFLDSGLNKYYSNNYGWIYVYDEKENAYVTNQSTNVIYYKDDTSVVTSWFPSKYSIKHAQIYLKPMTRDEYIEEMSKRK